MASGFQKSATPLKTPRPAVRVVPDKLRAGDEVRILALSRSIGGLKQYPGISDADVEFARKGLEALGLRVSFGRHVMETNAHLTVSVESRLEDLRDALNDASVKGILAVTGGIGAIQLLNRLDFELIAAHPKILCGYSDITFLCNAIYGRTGVVTYNGPHFSTFMMHRGFDYTLRYFRACLFDAAPFDAVASPEWSDDNWLKDQENRHYFPNGGWWGIHDGKVEGTVLGGGFFALNLLQGSEFFPPLDEAILFLEHPAEGKSTLMNLDMGLRALAHQPQFRKVRAIVIGRYASNNGGIDRDKMSALINDIPELAGLPVIANCDFGHTSPILTLPIGGRCRIKVSGGETQLTMLTH
jgi:muramoyltetrapeptide carboxypeptidase LdcA involved in peptidoglycan recycling